MIPGKNCESCRAFRRGDSETNEEADFGECRLMPPVLIVVDDSPMTMYPQVNSDCDCEQWEPAN